MTIKELKELIKEVPDDYTVNMWLYYSFGAVEKKITGVSVDDEEKEAIIASVDSNGGFC